MQYSVCICGWCMSICDRVNPICSSISIIPSHIILTPRLVCPDRDNKHNISNVEYMSPLPLNHYTGLDFSEFRKR